MTGPMIERAAYLPHEAAQALGVTENLVMRWLAAGRLPGRKVGKVWFIPIDGLQKPRGREAFSDRDRPFATGHAGSREFASAVALAVAETEPVSGLKVLYSDVVLGPCPCIVCKTPVSWNGRQWCDLTGPHRCER